MSAIRLILCAVGSAALGGVFLAAALPKLRNPRAFALTIVEYHVIPVGPSLLLARLLPPLELFATLLLFAGIAVRWAAALLAALLVSFCVAIAINLARGRDLDCGCFGSAAKTAARRVSPALLAQDSALLAVALCVCVSAPAGLMLAPWSLARIAGSWPAIPLVALAVCFLMTVIASVVLSRTKARQQAHGDRAHRLRGEAESAVQVEHAR